MPLRKIADIRGTLRLKVENIIKTSSFRIILLIYLALIIAFGISFFLLSYNDGNGIYQGDKRITNDVKGMLDSLYFSFVTSTSLGYGDIRPYGLSRLLSVTEVLVSLIIFGVLVSKLLYEKQDRILSELYDVSFQERFTRIIGGLYHFRIEINSIIDKLNEPEKTDTKELMQNMEANIHLLLNYIAESEKVISEEKKNSKSLPDVKTEIVLDSLHNSIAKLEELFSAIRKKKIYVEPKVKGNIQEVLTRTEGVCRKCVSLDYVHLTEIAKEVERHYKKIRREIYTGLK